MQVNRPPGSGLASVLRCLGSEKLIGYSIPDGGCFHMGVRCLSSLYPTALGFNLHLLIPHLCDPTLG